jgi:hypothetical protein
MIDTTAIHHPIVSRIGATALSLLVFGMPTQARAGDGEPVRLFNGTDLSGWSHHVVEPDVPIEAVWSVRDGLLVGTGEPLGYLHTLTEYTSFELVVEWRWAPGGEPGNSGVLMRINGEPRGIPRAYEAQLKSGDAGDLYGFWGLSLSGAPDRMHSVDDHDILGDLTGVRKIEGNENAPGEWNRYEIRFEGGNLLVRVNGRKVNEATGADVVAGQIGLQSEGGEIHFRKIELTSIE